MVHMLALFLGDAARWEDILDTCGVCTISGTMMYCYT
jgi:hypothetical protein